MTPRTVLLLALLVACAEPPADIPSDPQPSSGSDPAEPARPDLVPPAPAVAPVSLPVDTAIPVDSGLDGVPPGCRIVEPAAGAVVTAGAPTRFVAEVSDDDGDVLRVLWSSDRWGAMMVGEAFTFALPAGDHVVTLQVDDAAGHDCTQAIPLHVR